MTKNEQRVTRPLLRYHGGKWRLAPWILSHFPKHRYYTEVYGGGASVLLRKERSYAEVYNDLDGEVVNVFRVARDRGGELLEKLVKTPYARAEFREAWELVDEPVERARRAMVRSCMGFGSAAVSEARENGRIMTGFRSNSNRSGTTPAQDWQNYPDCFVAMMERLRGVVIENRPALEVLLQHDEPETLHYLDPPYVKSTRDKGSDYRYEMSDSDHREMAAVLRNLQGMVVLSGYDSELYGELFADWRRLECPHMADGARPRTEVLWFSPNVPVKVPVLEHGELFNGTEVAA